MNDEIKEILGILRRCTYRNEVYLIKEHGATILLDYITNLQQENERIKKMNMHEHKYGSDMEEKYLIEKTKNDRAVEYMQDFIFEPLLVQEDRKLIMYNENLRKFENILNGSDNNDN